MGLVSACKLRISHYADYKTFFSSQFPAEKRLPDQVFIFKKLKAMCNNFPMFFLEFLK